MIYDLGDFVKALKKPHRAGRELNRLCHTRGGRYNQNPRGTGIFEKDWDNLIILDACRYDYFSELSTLEGETTYRYSLSSATYEFIPSNFTNRQLLDTVYLGTIAWYLRLKDEINSEVYKYINLQNSSADVEWANKELDTPAPSSITDHAIIAAGKYPDKRLIVHYLQPHHPFIGPVGQNYSDLQSSSLIEVVQSANSPLSKLRDVYRENLEIVLEEVNRLLCTLNGKTAITADHGEMLGDRHDYVPIRDYGHHPGIYNDSTVKVPWHTYRCGDRKETVSESVPHTSEVEINEVDKTLRNLGYKM